MSQSVLRQAKAYLQITSKQGPSQQLIDFVNFDGKMGEEIGLEGFEGFSLNTQHEVLKSKLEQIVAEAGENTDEENAEGEAVLTAEETVDADDTEVKGEVVTVDPVELPDPDGAK